MSALNKRIQPVISQEMDDVKRADIVVLLTSAANALLYPEHLKADAVVLDDTQPRNTHPDLLKQRPDVTVIDGGLVSMNHLNLTRTVGLPRGLSYACLAETMLLAQAEYISTIARRFSHLGFDLAPDCGFGKRIVVPTSAFQPQPVLDLIPAL